MPDDVPWRGLQVETRDDVYEPAEDSFLLAAAVEALPAPRPGARALEVGPGSGLTAMALARAGYRVVAADVNPEAVRLTLANLRRNALDKHAAVIRGDMATAVQGPFDVVAFNAPYLPSEEWERVDGPLDAAFHGGDEGVEVALRLVEDLPRLLGPGGTLLLVLSTRGNVDRVVTAAARLGFHGTMEREERWFFEAVQVWSFRAGVSDK